MNNLTLLPVEKEDFRVKIADIFTAIVICATICFLGYLYYSYRCKALELEAESVRAAQEITMQKKEVSHD